MLWIDDDYIFSNDCSITFKKEKNGVRATISFLDSDVKYSTIKENKQEALDWAEEELVKIQFEYEGLIV